MIQNFSGLVILAITLMFIIFFAAIVLIRMNKKIMLLEKVKRIAVIKAMENERMRIAADLHDEIFPILSAIKIAISSIEDLPGGTEAIERATGLTDNII